MSDDVALLTKVKNVSDLTVDDIADILARAGVTLEVFAKQVYKWLHAKKSKYDRDGDIISEEEDTYAQIKAGELFLKLLSLINSNKDLPPATKNEIFVSIIKQTVNNGEVHIQNGNSDGHNKGIDLVAEAERSFGQ